jgi:hypothetical protein
MALRFLFTSAIVLSAGLLFLVQPMFARMSLPLLGGSPQVWATCMVFFQLTLLAGYGYAHWLSTRLAPRRQALVHGTVLLVPLVSLPIALDPGWVPPGVAHQEFWFLGVLAASVGLPFFAVSTTGPLLQRWFSHSTHERARDPYFLYAASNAGSMAGLLAYPLLVEPGLRLSGQGALWMYGYLVLIALTWAIAGVLWGTGAQAPAPDTSRAADLPAPVGWRRALRWVALAFVPSSLMLGVTTHITTDIAVAPLFWVIPLALYLLSFVLVFSRRNPFKHRVLARALPVLAIVLALLLVSGTNEPVMLALLVNLGFFFVAAMVCHGELAADRPGVHHLTLFYLLLAVGGALGGVFNALLSPVLFDSVAEYPIAIVLACLLCPPRAPEKTGRWRWTDAVPGLAVGGILLGLSAAALPLSEWAGLGGEEFDTLRTAVVVGLPLVGCYLLVRHPLRFAAALGAWYLAGSFVYEQNRGALLYTERSFFGVHRVNLHEAREAKVLRHGFTAHGMQKLDPALRRTATTYYHASGPAGQVLRAFGARISELGIVGLGAGTMAVYATPGRHVTFYEIDPVVVRIAENPELFSFISDARAAGASLSIVPGDARLSLEREPDKRFDLLAIDAFTNDSIPVHLLTREALDLYFRKLSPGGVLLLHVSNERLDVSRPLGDLAADAGLFAVFQDSVVENARQRDEGKFHSQWVAMVRDPEVLAPLAESAGRWQILGPVGDRIWTDDYSNILSLIRALH